MTTFTIAQLTPATCPDPRPAPELCLHAAVVQMAPAFLALEDFEVFCDWLAGMWWRSTKLVLVGSNYRS